MNLFKNVFVLASLLTLSLSIHAESGDKGNGGDAIVCPDKIILLDRYEAEKRKFKIDLEGSTLEDMVKSLVARYKKFDYRNGLEIEKLALAMVEDIKLYDAGSDDLKLFYLSESPLTDIPDSNETSIPAGCKKEQLIINKRGILFPEDKKFEMRSDFWEKMSLVDRALTITHEAIYDNQLGMNVAIEDSRIARYLNGFFARNERDFNLGNFLDVIKRFSFSYTWPEVINKLDIEIDTINSQRGWLYDHRDHTMVGYSSDSKLHNLYASAWGNHVIVYPPSTYEGDDGRTVIKTDEDGNIDREDYKRKKNPEFLLEADKSHVIFHFDQNFSLKDFEVQHYYSPKKVLKYASCIDVQNGIIRYTPKNVKDAEDGNTGVAERTLYSPEMKILKHTLDVEAMFDSYFEVEYNGNIYRDVVSIELDDKNNIINVIQPTNN